MIMGFIQSGYLCSRVEINNINATPRKSDPEDLSMKDLSVENGRRTILLLFSSARYFNVQRALEPVANRGCV